MSGGGREMRNESQGESGRKRREGERRRDGSLCPFLQVEVFNLTSDMVMDELFGEQVCVCVCVCACVRVRVRVRVCVRVRVFMSVKTLHVCVCLTDGGVFWMDCGYCRPQWRWVRHTSHTHTHTHTHTCTHAHTHTHTHMHTQALTLLYYLSVFPWICSYDEIIVGAPLYSTP